LKLYPNGQIAQ